jgi:hypothetical protein
LRGRQQLGRILQREQVLPNRSRENDTGHGSPSKFAYPRFIRTPLNYG